MLSLEISGIESGICYMEINYSYIPQTLNLQLLVSPKQKKKGHSVGDYHLNNTHA